MIAPGIYVMINCLRVGAKRLQRERQATNVRSAVVRQSDDALSRGRYRMHCRRSKMAGTYDTLSNFIKGRGLIQTLPRKDADYLRVADKELVRM